jgi:hypothetical protein
MGKFDYLLHAAKPLTAPHRRVPDKPLCVRGTCRYFPVGGGRLMQCRRCLHIQRTEKP